MSNCLRFKVSYIHGKNVKIIICVWKQCFHNINWNILNFSDVNVKHCWLTWNCLCIVGLTFYYEEQWLWYPILNSFYIVRTKTIKKCLWEQSLFTYAENKIILVLNVEHNITNSFWHELYHNLVTNFWHTVFNFINAQ